jgi:biotin carboxyl carrier protein
MIRIGSQVDLVVPRAQGLEIKVQTGDRVRAGETLLIE